jgi:hypothetical protein
MSNGPLLTPTWVVRVGLVFHVIVDSVQVVGVVQTANPPTDPPADVVVTTRYAAANVSPLGSVGMSYLPKVRRIVAV